MEQVIHTFYKAFSALDAEAMVACYHDDVIFSDPAFGNLRGERAKNMWRMLCDTQKGKDFKVVYTDISANNLEGRAHWEAFYTYSKTDRKIHNTIQSTFQFKDGKIIAHHDDFSIKNWAKQAYGFKGVVIGGTLFFKSKVQSRANAMLDKFIENRLKN